ncbi:MAG: polynucleotide adenylyltransferase PcnB, partial [Gammaproteobacteria bacterium]
MFSRIRNLFRPQVAAATAGGLPRPRVIPRGKHPVSPASISPAAQRVLEGLHQGGFRACLVGGGVRDLLLGREPKDFDVTTDATPEQVRRLFRNARIIGRRFRIVHVRFGREIVEVATFRANDPDAVNTDEDGRIISDNVYGTIETDALRRDFTVNALYYDHADGSVLDFAGGMEDLKAGRLRLIGDPDQRFREDPVRMLRAVRFAAKLGFIIEQPVQEAILRQAETLEGIAPARLFEEVLKMFHAGYAVETFEQLRHFGLFR